MFIWSGWGFAIVLFAILGIGVIGNIPGIPVGLGMSGGLLLAAIATFFLARWRNKQPQRHLVDPMTGQAFVIKDGSSLFFIPIAYWVYILAVLAALSLLIVE